MPWQPAAGIRGGRAVLALPQSAAACWSALAHQRGQRDSHRLEHGTGGRLGTRHEAATLILERE